MKAPVLIERRGVADVCKAGYDGCCKIPEVMWRCVREGRDAGLCGACARVWRIRVASDPVLRERCPKCEKAGGSADSARPVPPASCTPLQGSVADAIRHAMHMEGLLVDKQDAVLRRLAREAAWLELPDFKVQHVPG